jgi:hypothetical protein
MILGPWSDINETASLDGMEGENEEEQAGEDGLEEKAAGQRTKSFALRADRITYR